MVDIREQVPHNETEDARRQREAVEQYIAHSQRELRESVERHRKYVDSQIALLEKTMREFDASRKTRSDK